jgi:hypothetical protein
LVGNNIKLAKFTKISLFDWQKYKVGQIYKFAIEPFFYFELLGLLGLKIYEL